VTHPTGITDQRLLIDGKLVAAADGRTFDNINPATGEVAGVAPDAGRADVDAAVAAARRAFDTTGWSTDVGLRRHCLRQLHSALRDRLDDMRPLVIAESGAPIATTHMTQLDWAVDYISHYVDLLGEYDFERALPDKDIFGMPTKRLVLREAAGVVAAITPWNYPVYLNLCKVSAALAAGCTVVLKPAPDTPWGATLLGQIAAEHTDLPPGVLNVITTSDNDVAAALVEHPGVDQVSFTGSTATGKRIMASAAGTVKRVTLELGGKSAAVVLDDADLTQVVPMVAGGVVNHAGQGCVLLTRLVVPRSRLAEAVAIAEETLRVMPWGDPLDPGVFGGPLISARQRDSVLRYYALAAEEGRIVLGGTASDRFERGYYVEPTLITDIEPTARVAQEEIFGPALVVLPYDGDDAAGDLEALRIADSTPYGLSGAVFSADPGRAIALSRRMRTGTVGVNGAQWFDTGSPFGGYKQSGLGREWGTEGLEDFLETKTIAYF
jgi:aldehyde dehydrogenase (NAD+)